MEKRKWTWIIGFLSVFFMTSLANEYAIRSTTYLYSAPEENSEKLGVFARGGRILKLEDAAAGWWKIEADNEMTGYIQSGYITKHLNGFDSYEADPEVFDPDNNKRRDMNPRLYVRAASLRTRKKPDVSGEIGQILLANTTVTVCFYPYNEEEWVNIYGGTIHKESRQYVKRKFLGKRFELDDVIRIYNELDSTDTVNRKLWVERLMEMSWTEQPDDKVRILVICDAFWKEQQNVRMTEIVDFELFRAKAMQYPLSPEENANYYDADHCFMILNDRRYPWMFSIESLSKELPCEKKEDLGDDNACDDADYLLIFKSFVVNVYASDKEVDKGFVSYMDLTVEGNGIVINSFQIDKDTEERDFIAALGKIIHVHYSSPHTYHLHMSEVSGLTIIFKNGKPVSYTENIYC